MAKSKSKARSGGKSGKGGTALANGTNGSGKSGPPPLTAETADRHACYQAAVQNVEAEIDFVDATYKKLRRKRAVSLREDFAGTGATSCEWVRRRPTNTAVGLDIDVPTLKWGMVHNVGPLTTDQRARVRLVERDVREPGDAVGVDCLLAMNFSYWLFQTRQEMIDYFKGCRESLADDGILFLDFYGGSEAMTECEERRSCKLAKDPAFPGRSTGKFTYVWDQHRYLPVTGEMNCFIHFEFPDGSRLKNAFRYTWRLWTLPELLEVLKDAGFANPVVYWEGDELDDDGDPTGEGNGIFKPEKKGETCQSFICYIVAEK